MIKSNIKQHFVPKSYLKRFGKKNLNNKGYNIAVKQLKSNKIFIDSINNVAFRKIFMMLVINLIRNIWRIISPERLNLYMDQR